MKKPSSKIRDEIARLQEQLKAAETREAERVGRIALKAGLGEIEVDEAELQAAFEDLAKRFRGDQGSGKTGSTGKARAGAGGAVREQAAAVPPGAAESSIGEA
ncbi:conjugal transfer protein TraC [Phyllobacterium chamaecytisi]|uniref:conjugal transfer protein TraC n=1 Tax=Phyllobacterium chamaecytisi TaxID=2876082 RepID=UPI001CCE18D5|nr:conjugal transfer protein TraC [Phyllobacterium sp. KW56]MBZ9603376.1 TraC family protein [Phyllobacterium sp. KW56]